MLEENIAKLWSSYSAKAEYPVRRGLKADDGVLWNTGSPAFAGDDSIRANLD